MPTSSNRYFRRNLARERDRVAALPIWGGRNGPRNKRCLMAVYNVAIRAGARTITFTERLAAELLGVNKTTANRRIRDLRAAGWLRPQGKLRYGRDTLPLYYLSVPEQYQEFQSVSSITLVPREMGASSERSDGRSRLVLSVWGEDRNGEGLGPAAGMVHELLSSDKPSSVTGLAERTGLHYETVRVKLKVLESHHLARREGRRWFQGELDPAELGEALDTGKRRRELTAAHKREREQRELVLTAKESIESSGRPEVVKAAIAQRPAATAARPELPAPKIGKDEAMRNDTQPGTRAVLHGKNTRLDGRVALIWHHPAKAMPSKRKQHIQVVRAEEAQQFQEGNIYTIDLSEGVAA